MLVNSIIAVNVIEDMELVSTTRSLDSECSCVLTADVVAKMGFVTIGR